MSEVTQADRAKVQHFVAISLGYKDWDDATDYRTTGRQDMQRDKAFDLALEFYAAAYAAGLTAGIAQPLC